MLQNSNDAPVNAAAQLNESKHLIERCQERRDLRQGPSAMVIGHMGGSLDGPENSIRSFRAAIEANLEGIEFDVSDCNTR